MPRRLWPPDGGGLCSLRSGGDSPNGLRVVVSPPLAAMSIKSALRDYLLCLQCCMTKSQSPFHRKGVAPQATEDRSVSSFLNLFGPILSPIGQLLPEEGACVTRFPLVSPMLHGVVPEPPSPGRGLWRRQAPEDRGVSSFLKFSVFLRASPSFILYFTTSHPRRQCFFPRNHEPRNQKMTLLGYIMFL